MGNTTSLIVFRERKNGNISQETEKQLAKEKREEIQNEKEKNEKEKNEKGDNKTNEVYPILSGRSIIEKPSLNAFHKEKENTSIENVTDDRITKKNTNGSDTMKIQKLKEEEEEEEEKDKIEMIKKENFYLFDETLNSNKMKHPCHAQWFLLWIYASYLSERFNALEKKDVYDFYTNFPDQCIVGRGKYCYTEFVNLYPIKAKTREELMMWLQMCENYCRKKAELPTKVFNYKKLLKRWRYDDGYV